MHPGEEPDAGASGSPRPRVENDAFYATSPAAPPPVIEERAFYADAQRPAAEPPVLLSIVQSPVKLGAAMFLIGWTGIIVQQGFFSQVVAGAPLFEEPAKVGGALVLSGLLSMRLLLLRLPIAAGFGAAFGVFEHALTYGGEDATSYAIRVAFHALSTATSMAAFTALEADPDVRLRWATTLPATFLHYANNFMALVLAFASLALPAAGTVATWWAIGITGLLALSLVLIAARPAAFRRQVARLAARFIPSMRTA